MSESFEDIADGFHRYLEVVVSLSPVVPGTLSWRFGIRVSFGVQCSLFIGLFDVVPVKAVSTGHNQKKGEGRWNT